MPAVVTATVVRWEIDWTQTPPAIYWCDNKSISVVMADGANGSDLSPVVAQYILDESMSNAGFDAAKCQALLAATRDGLVQVHGSQRAQFAAPPIPARTRPVNQPPNPMGSRAGEHSQAGRTGGNRS